MAKITIREEDNSTVAYGNSSSNIVYVPGYAVSGPVNEPTLCTSLESFQSKFGTVPYVYKANQLVGNTVVAVAGDYEKSYLYAIELLKQGFQVLYERIYTPKSGSVPVIAQLSIPFVAKKKVCQFTDGSTTLYANYIISGNAGSWSVVNASNVAQLAYTVTDVSDDTIFIKKESTSGETVTTTDIGEFNVNVVDVQTTTDVSCILSAKYVGTYGRAITASLEEAAEPYIELDGSYHTLYILMINSDRFIVSFEKDSKYFIDNVLANNSVVNVTTVIPSTYVETGLYKANNVATVNFTLPSGSYVEGEDEMTVEGVIDKLGGPDSPYSDISDRSLYDVKFVTSGGYGAFGYYGTEDKSAAIATAILDCCATRADATGLIDGEKGISRDDYAPVVNELFPTSIVNGRDRNCYGAIFAPWQKVVIGTTKTGEWMPASFCYLYDLANSVKSNPIWLPVSGVNRGMVANFVDTEFPVTEGLINQWQARFGGTCSINPVTNIRPYGQVIWGGRTIFRNVDELKASSFLNIRVLANEIKKTAYQVIQSLLFESNDLVLWNTFKGKITPVLDQMKSNRGISDYKVERQNTNRKATVSGIIRIMPIEPVEDFEITFSLEDNVINIG